MLKKFFGDPIVTAFSFAAIVGFGTATYSAYIKAAADAAPFTGGCISCVSSVFANASYNFFAYALQFDGIMLISLLILIGLYLFASKFGRINN